MDNIGDRAMEKENSGNYVYLVKKIGKEAISSRYDWVNHLMASFIRKKGYQERVLVSDDILRHVIVDYFVDIDRLIEFQEIESVHSSKIYAYLAYWILRHKPMQITVSEGAAGLCFVNEEFACSGVTFFRSLKMLQSWKTKGNVWTILRIPCCIISSTEIIRPRALSL